MLKRESGGWDYVRMLEKRMTVKEKMNRRKNDEKEKGQSKAEVEESCKKEEMKR